MVWFNNHFPSISFLERLNIRKEKQEIIQYLNKQVGFLLYYPPSYKYEAKDAFYQDHYDNSQRNRNNLQISSKSKMKPLKFLQTGSSTFTPSNFQSISPSSINAIAPKTATL